MPPKEAYPLAWPEGWKRTPAKNRERSQFDTNFVRARDGVLHELRLMRATKVIITSDLPVKSNGLPYATGRADDPAIAVWWVQGMTLQSAGKERVMACDRYVTHAENMQAIHKSIQALRGLERWGASDIVERAFAGFTALPPGSGSEIVSRDWWDVLGIEPGLFTQLSAEDLRAVVKARHHKLALTAHPDRGGSADQMVVINAALEEAEKYLVNLEANAAR